MATNVTQRECKSITNYRPFRPYLKWKGTQQIVLQILFKLDLPLTKRYKQAG